MNLTMKVEWKGGLPMSSYSLPNVYKVQMSRLLLQQYAFFVPKSPQIIVIEKLNSNYKRSQRATPEDWTFAVSVTVCVFRPRTEDSVAQLYEQALPVNMIKFR